MEINNQIKKEAAAAGGVFVVMLLMSGVVFVTSLSSSTTTVYATTTTESAVTEEVVEEGEEQYVNKQFGYQFGYPSDWVFEDYTEKYANQYLQAERQVGYGFLGALCPEDAAIPSLGTEHSCDTTMSTTEADFVGFIRFLDLDNKIARELGISSSQQQREEQGIGNLTTDDVFAYYVATVLSTDSPDSLINDAQKVQELVSETPIQIAVIDSASGQVIRQIDAALIEFTYGSNTVPFAPVFRAYQVFAIDGETGYSFGIEATEDELDSGEVPEVLQTVIDTFALIEN